MSQNNLPKIISGDEFTTHFLCTIYSLTKLFGCFLKRGNPEASEGLDEALSTYACKFRSL
jgi:hypothetical protein